MSLRKNGLNTIFCLSSIDTYGIVSNELSYINYFSIFMSRKINAERGALWDKDFL